MPNAVSFWVDVVPLAGTVMFIFLTVFLFILLLDLVLNGYEDWNA